MNTHQFLDHAPHFLVSIQYVRKDAIKLNNSFQFQKEQSKKFKERDLRNNYAIEKYKNE